MSTLKAANSTPATALGNPDDPDPTVVPAEQAVENNPFPVRAGGGVAPTDDPRDTTKVAEAQTAMLPDAKALQDWEERKKLEGKIVYVCPFCEGGLDKREPFATPADCQVHIDTAHPGLVEATKQGNLKAAAEGRAPTKFEPREYLVEPKRRLEDYMTPEQAAMHRAAIASSNVVAQEIKKVSGFGTTNVATSMLQLAQPGIAATEVVKLGDKELLKAYTQARNMSKTQVARAARREIERRKLDVPA